MSTQLTRCFWRGITGTLYFVRHCIKGVVTFSSMPVPNRIYTQTLRAFLRTHTKAAI